MRARPRRAPGFLLAALLLPLCPAARAADFPQNALELFNGADYAGALALLEKTFPPGAAEPQGAEASFWKGACLLKLKRYEEALAQFMSALPDKGSARADPAYSGRTLLFSGITLEELGRYAEAGAAYSGLISATGEAPLKQEAIFRLAGIELRAGHPDRAGELYSRIVLDSPSSRFVADALFFLAECDRARGDWEAAGRRYKAVLSTFPDSPYRLESTLGLAEIAYASGKNEEALRLIGELERTGPGKISRRAMLLKGAALFRSGAFEGSARAFEAALGFSSPDSPEAAEAHFDLASSFHAAGNTQEAASHYGFAAACGSGEIKEQSLSALSRLCVEFGDHAGAVAALARLADELPGSSRREETLFLLAGLLQAGGDAEGAIRRLGSLIMEFPSSALLDEYLYRRGCAFLSKGDLPSALEDFQRIARSFPASVFRGESLFAVGSAYADRREYSRAIPYLQAAYAASGNADLRLRSMRAVGACQFNIGDYADAYAGLDALLKESDPDYGLFYDCARALYRLGRYAESAERFSRASELAGSPAAAADARYWLAWSLFKQEDYQGAAREFLDAGERYPGPEARADCLLQAALSMVRLGDDPGALDIVDRAIAIADAARLADVREKALYEKGSALARLGRRSESERILGDLAREFPAGRLAAEAFFRDAAEAADKGRRREAVAGFLKVYRTFPKDQLAAQALYWAAENSLLGGDAHGAAELFWEYIVYNGEGAFLASALDGLERCFSTLKNPDLSLEYVRRARLEPALTPYILSSMELDYARLEISRNPKAARSTAEEVSRRMLPESLLREAGLILGECSMAERQWKRAKEILLGLASSKGDRVSALARLEYARALWAEGNVSEAMQVFAGISTLYPAFPDLGAEGVFLALKAARTLGDTKNAYLFQEKLKKDYPDSAWTARINPRYGME